MVRSRCCQMPTLGVNLSKLHLAVAEIYTNLSSSLHLAVAIFAGSQRGFFLPLQVFWYGALECSATARVPPRLCHRRPHLPSVDPGAVGSLQAG